MMIILMTHSLLWCKKEQVPSTHHGSAPMGAQWLRTGREGNCGEIREDEPPRTFFSRQRGEEMAKFPLSIKNSRLWPYQACKTFLVTILKTFKTVRGLSNFVLFKLITIHPNPGPHARDNEARRIRRLDRRKERRKTLKEGKSNFLRIITWNVQGMSVGTWNLARAKSVGSIAVKNKWDLVMLTEIRANQCGVVNLGSAEEPISIIFSNKAGILLRGDLLSDWISGGEIKMFGERSLSIKIRKVVYTSTYLPVYHHNNQESIEAAKAELKAHVDWSNANEIHVVGGDFNAHIGGKEERPGVCGKFGLRRSNEQGLDLLQFCEENGLAYCNSFYNHRKRGTWFNRFNNSWYELDGFLMRKNQRHKNVKKICTFGEMSVSDHKPKMLIFMSYFRKQGVKDREIKVPKINFEKLKNEDTEKEFRDKIREMLYDGEDEDLDLDDIDKLEDGDEIPELWSKITNTVTKAAAAVCGERTKSVECPWLVDKQEIIQTMRSRITVAVEARNRILEQFNANDEHSADIIEEAINELKEARIDLKRSTKKWEKDWWENILIECERASERGDSSTVYRNLKLLGTRDFKKAPTSTKISTEEFRDHFKAVSENRYENDPEVIEEFLREVPDISNTDEALYWKDVLDEIPQQEEIIKQMKLMKDSSPGEDQVRISYLLKAGEEIRVAVVKMVQYLFVNNADKWEDTLKTGVVIPLHKKGDRDNPNNYRGICLLSMGSRILARILADRVRIWSEEMNLLDDEQAGFRKNRSTADATQVMVRIQEDSIDLRKRMEASGRPIDEEEMPAARLLDLRKA